MLNVKRHWSEKITVWQNSGLSIAAWCRQNGESYHRFLYWRRRLQQTTKPCSANGLEGNFIVAARG